MTEASPVSADEVTTTAGTAASKTSTPRALRGRWLTTAEAVLYVVAALTITYPGIRDLSGHIIGSVDAETFTWLGWRIGRLIASGHFPTRVPDTVYPYGYDLRIVDGYGGYVLTGIWNLVAGPILAYNLTILTAVVANCWAGRQLAGVVTSRRLTRVLTALAFGTAPMVGLRAFGHVHLCFVFATAMVVAEGLRFCLGKGPLRPVRLGLWLFVAFLFSIYFLLSSVIALLVMIGIATLRQRGLLRSVVLRMGIAFLIVGALMTPFVIPRIQFERAEQRAVDRQRLQELDNERNTVKFSADALSILAPPAHATVKLPGADALRKGFDDNDIEATIFPGLLLLAGLAGLLALRSRPRVPLLAAAGVLWVLSMGPVLLVRGLPILTDVNGGMVRWLPFQLLTSVPGFSSLRTPSRMTFALPAILAAGLAMTLTYLFTRWPRWWQHVLVVGTGICLLSLNLVTPLGTSDFAVTPPVENALRHIADVASPKDSLMEVPFDCSGDTSSVKLQILHHRPEVGCQGQASAIPWYSGLAAYKQSAALAALRCFPPLYGYAATRFNIDIPWQPTGWQALHKQFGLRYVMVDRVRLADPPCDARRHVINEALSELHRVTEDHRWIIFELASDTGNGA